MTTMSKKGSVWRSIKKNWQLYMLISPVLLYFIVFHYLPMYGVQIAFKDFMANKGIWDSPWVGFKHFARFFDSYFFERLMINTLTISFYTLLLSFPIPILLALMVNEVQSTRFKKIVQTVTYAPHFLSIVVVVGMMFIFLHPSTGIVNHMIVFFGGEPIRFMTDPNWFKTLYVFSDVWQTTGWSSIIYLAALSGVDHQLHEAATMDGANKMQRIWYINLPSIAPTIIILLILNLGSVMAVGFEKIFLMQNSLNMASSDVISTYVYRAGILDAQYSFSAAIGLFNSVVNFALLIVVNYVARRVNQTSLW
ncbi:ABC transporter permease [Paenibacillus sp. 481]|uniref:ABC transporter permease n=1 Tax=Paenibacillus sp. 481 TaxID=2835869 RepID=UPI001E457C57|nr:ABC transporter permease subunit [Paenibacillus sp. 481]UHA71829.1 sugar ABC transporter permease [Paenibacillus sp. 481]